MNNYMNINGKKFELTEELAKLILKAVGEQGNQKAPDIQLSGVAVGDIVKIGDFEMVVLEQMAGQTAMILKDLLGETMHFGENNNYDGSYVDEACRVFAQELSEIIGWDNILLHQVDLTADDGLKDYGAVERRASLLTADQYRRYVEILEKFKPAAWWWLATPFSTATHDNDRWAKCVSPSGYFFNYNFNYFIGVRPFCILKSTIFVSK